ncbi:MAG: Type I restriction-modification system, S subunit/Type I restriction modification DNA specificity [uncultured bacterium]|nr:MAG: Type I restriction-modification system, S subunit/Type I restriction modification DNA specificity [uncultured bacterium]
MIDVLPEHLKIIIDILKRFVPSFEVRAFGSRCKGKSKKYSDLDLAIVGNEKIDSNTILEIKEAFEESNLPYRVDVLDWNAISNNFRKIINEKYEVIQKAQDNFSDENDLPDGWDLKSINEIAEVIGGGTPSTKNSDYFGNEIPWITPKDLSNYENVYISRGERCITKKGLENCSAKILPKGAVLLTTRAPIGYVAIASNEVTTNQGFRSLIPKKNYSSEFIYYLLKSSKEVLIANSSGTTFGELSGSALKKIEFSFPKLDEQKSIASILSSLDDKIELNRKMNETLEKTAQAIFKQWFIDFEFPDENGKPYKSSGGKMVETEFGEIPKGWRMSSLKEEFNITMGQSPPGESYNENSDGILFYQGRTDFDFRFPKPRIFCVKPQRFAEKFNTLVSVRAPVGDINMALDKCCIGRGLSAVIHKNNYFSYTFYKITSLKPIFQGFESEGTVFGSINKTNFENIEAIIPEESIIKMFEKLVNPIDLKIYEITKEINILTELRDLLLPKLMSGKIRVTIDN